MNDELERPKYGRLTILESLGRINNRYYSKCLCECGNIVIKRTDRVKHGNTRSCGCLGDETRKINAPKARKRQNRYHINGNIVEMFTASGYKFIIDKDDFEKVCDGNWYEDKAGYIEGRVNRHKIKLHRFIINCPKELEVDHINHDKSDNRKCNLRIVTRSQNNMNHKLRKNSKSGKTGVNWYERGKKWEAGITVNKKHIYLGRYNNLADAIKARKDAEIKYFGEYAYKE
jgi:hypothetical protein